MTKQANHTSSDGPALYVGIGASAGGLEAIEAFFTHTPPDTDLAFIVVQHLSPDYKSLMVELLSKKTAMPVHRAEEGMLVQANHVYLIPPKKNLTIFHGKLLLSEQDHSKGINLPIDVFLRSLAEDQGEKVAGVILSGTGSDGVRGVRAIKEAGGMVMVQDEESAKFDGMPRAAVATGLADFVLPPDQMPLQLTHFVKHPYMVKGERSETLLSDEDGLTRVFAILRERCKVDFTFYKPSTVNRRIERRITINQCNDIREYVAHLQNSPTEVQALYRELLIGVTSFFRDLGAFERLGDKWLPELFKSHPSRELRFWVAGCSTGEEAYTLAILTRERMEQMGLSFDLKIFATDIDRDAVHTAASGVYPESIAADLPPNLLAKYFYRRDESFQIARTIREMVVFAQHNLIKDPPFTNIDLISCRNLLIYLQPILQKKVLELFNFSLPPGGLLLLGTSETTGEMADYFDPLDHRFKIYRSRGRHRQIAEPITLIPGSEGKFRDLRQRFSGGRRPGRQGEEERVLDRLLQALAGEYLPLSLVVNEQLEVLHVVGDTEGFFKLPSGKVVNDISKMVSKELAIPLSTGIQKVFRSRQEFRFSNIKLQYAEGTRVVEMRLMPLPEKKGQEPLVVVMIGQVRVDKAAPGVGEAPPFDLSQEAEQHIRDLEQDLQFTKENLQATIEELETANEELQATNEELLASNEELQSTNEELQSTNEELHTVNTEYQNKIIELTELHNDVDNLLTSTRIGQLILDENLEIRRFSAPIAEIFRVLDSDVGRPLSHLSHYLVDVDPLALVQQVQESAQFVETEVTTKDGRWFLMRVVPYHVGPDHFSGVVLVFVDLTSLKRAEQDLMQSDAWLRLAQEAAKAGTWEWDLQSNRNQWSEEVWRLYGLEPHCCEPSYQAWLETVHPEDRQGTQDAVHEAVQKGLELNAEWRVALPSGEERWLMSRGQPVRGADGKVTRYMGIVMDMTRRKQAESLLRVNEEKYIELLENMSNGVAVYQAVDDGEDFVFLAFNRAGERIERVNRDQVLGRRLTQVLPGMKDFGLLDVLRRVWRSGSSEHLPLAFYKDERIEGWREYHAYRLMTGEVVAVYNDLTRQRQVELASECLEERFRLALEATGQAVFDWDVASGQMYYSPSWNDILQEEDLPPRYDTWESRLHPEDRQATLESLRLHLSGQTPRWSCDHRLRTGGGWKWLLGQGRVVARDAQGRPLRMVGAMRDIAARKAVEDELRANRNLNFTFAAAGLDWWEWDLSRQWLAAGASLAELLGFELGELGGPPDAWLSLIHPEDRAKVSKAMQEFLEGVSLQYNVVYRLRHKTGEYRSYQDRVMVAERDQEGRMARLLGALSRADQPTR